VIVDTSALVAVSRKEEHFEPLLDAMIEGEPIVPAPVLVEYHRVTALGDNRPDPDAEALIAGLIEQGAFVSPFDQADAEVAVAANPTYGNGNGQGGRLNMLDLMVYAVAKRTGLPILCTGRDFAGTDAKIHPASRTI